MQSNLDLKADKYNPPTTLNLFVKCLSAVSIGALIIGLYGDGIAKKEICFYPTTARKHDADVRLSAKGKELFGSKFCKPEHLVIIPTQLEKEQKYQSSNPTINKWARLINQDTYTMRDIPADNPYKGIAGIIAAVTGLGLLGANKQLIDYMNSLRPQYRANKQLEGKRSGIALKTQERLLELSAEELIKYWRGIAVAEAKITFIQNLTIQQANLLMTGMSAEEYEQFGHVIDGGQSFNRYSPVVETPEGRPDASGRLPEAEQQDKYHWINNTIGYPTLIFGGMGAGKSWTTREVIWKKVNAGHKVYVLDPHGTKVEWQGVEFISSYEEIAKFMQWYRDELRQRYEDFRNSGMTEDEWTNSLRQQGKQLSVIAEEFTTWADNITEPMPINPPNNWKPDPEFIGSWFRCAMTESRKQLMCPLFVAHARTLGILGNAKNLSRLRDSSLLEIELMARIDPVTTEAKASGMGQIKLPGHGQWLPIELPKLDKKRIDFRVNTNPQNPQTVVEQLAASLDSDPQLMPASQKIIAWLRGNRKDTWVKFKGKSERDSSFINFLSKNNIESDTRDEAIKELTRWELVDIRNEGSEIKPTEF